MRVLLGYSVQEGWDAWNLSLTEGNSGSEGVRTWPYARAW